MGDGDYMYAFQQVVMPIAQEFNPDLVISRWLSLNMGTSTYVLQLPLVLMLLLVMSLEVVL